MIVNWFYLFKVLDHVANMEITGWSLYNLPPFLLIFSNLQGGQMIVAHELFHKPGWCNQVFGTIEQCKNLYMHFIYEHLYGHHRNVATPLDPATSPKGLTVY